MDERKKTDSVLLSCTVLDIPDKLDTQWQAHATELTELIGKAAKVDVIPILVARASVDTNGHNAVALGLTYLALTDPDESPSYVQFLEATMRDDMAFVITSLGMLVHEKFPRLLPTPRQQLLWLLAHFVSSHVSFVKLSQAITGFCYYLVFSGRIPLRVV